MPNSKDIHLRLVTVIHFVMINLVGVMIAAILTKTQKPSTEIKMIFHEENTNTRLQTFDTKASKISSSVNSLLFYDHKCSRYHFQPLQFPTGLQCCRRAWVPQATIFDFGWLERLTFWYNLTCKCCVPRILWS